MSKKGHEKEALNLMSAYLPKDSANSFPFSDGGGLYALGIIHANHGGEIIEYLLTQLKAATTEVKSSKMIITLLKESLKIFNS